MKRSTDEIRYLILKALVKKHKDNIESIREDIGTGLPSILHNVEDLEIFGFVKLNEMIFGKRKYRELEITKEGEIFFDKIRKKFER